MRPGTGKQHVVAENKSPLGGRDKYWGLGKKRLLNLEKQE